MLVWAGSQPGTLRPQSAGGGGLGEVDPIQPKPNPRRGAGCRQFERSAAPPFDYFVLLICYVCIGVSAVALQSALRTVP